MLPEHSWVVLKFGGTSVSSAANWRQIAGIVASRVARRSRMLIVHSALSGVTDSLDKLCSAGAADCKGALELIHSRHVELARELGCPLGSSFEAAWRELCADLEARSTRSEEDLRARVLASGELMATSIGCEYLRSQNLPVSWMDARQILHSVEREHAAVRASRLNATCDFTPDPALRSALANATQIVVTQGFIASNAQGQTVLLGRGGSDTSAAYFAAKLQAEHLEIWTDVPGMFSANPRDIPAARLLRALHYDEALEIASNGAKVLHPRCLMPVKHAGIALHVYATQAPHLEGTVISGATPHSAGHVKAIAVKRGITLVSMDSPGMWHQVGFLADAFQIFKRHGLSVDLVSTSETTVTVSLDAAANTLDAQVLGALTASLESLCRVQVIGPCASLSLLGRNIRAILPELGEAFELFRDEKVFLVSQAANDLNFTFVVDESQADRLSSRLHERLIQSIGSDQVLGPSWAALFRQPMETKAADTWWRRSPQRERLLEIGREGAAYVYELDSVRAAVASLASVPTIRRWAYAMKANWHPQILRLLHDSGFMFDCVSLAEVEHAFASVKNLKPTEILFTPNFAPRVEYVEALRRGVRVCLDNLFPLHAWADTFRGQEIFVRIDPGFGRGHHAHVRTAGAHTKFGVPLFELDELARAADAAGAKIVGLHAHAGSGVFEPASWAETGEILSRAADRFPAVRAVDLGGGLGVPDREGQRPVELTIVETHLAALQRQFPQLEFWMEPGRYLVAEAGVLIAPVTQIKGKGDVRYVGVSTGMNSLIRPALYGAHHEIVNLTRLMETPQTLYQIVGPICESADLLGHDRWLPETREGDVLLIAGAGAYGRAMSSHYNLRAPAHEIVL